VGDKAVCVSKRADPDSPHFPMAGQYSSTEVVGTQRWGHISRSTGRYGSVTTHLVVYPPDSFDRERLWADASRTLTPLGIGGAVIAAIVLLGTGASPELTLLSIAGLFVIGWVVLSSRTIGVRRKSASIWVCTSAISPDHDRSRAQTHLEALAETMTEAASARRAGTITADQYTRAWRNVFGEVTLLSLQRNG